MSLERRTPLAQGKPLTGGKPLARGAGMARGKPMSRGSAQLARTPAPARTSPPPARRTAPVARSAPTGARSPERAPGAPERARPRPAARHTGPTAAVRALVIARDGGVCARCGAPATNVQHRRGRGAGGTKGEESQRINGVAWLISVCGQGNTSGCHGAVEADRQLGEREGYRIARNGVGRDAALVPVLTRDGWVVLGDDGTRGPCPAPPGGDARNAG